MERGQSAAAAATSPSRALLALEIGIAAVLVLAPLPEGSVREPARTLLEVAAISLGLLWIVRAARAPVAIPSRAALAGLLGLLALAALQALPLGAGAVGALSPRALEARSGSRPPREVAAAEARLLLLRQERIQHFFSRFPDNKMAMCNIISRQIKPLQMKYGMSAHEQCQKRHKHIAKQQFAAYGESHCYCLSLLLFNVPGSCRNLSLVAL